MPLEQPFERVTVEILVVRNHLDQPGKVRKEVSLVAVREDRRDGCVVELHLGVVDLDEMDGGVRMNDWSEGDLDCCRDGALESQNSQ